MVEVLAIPGWDQPPAPIARWVEAFEGQGLTVEVVRDSPQGSWVEVRSLRLRGYAVTAGIKVEAINFELHDPDPTPAREAVARAAAALAWDLDEDQDEDEDDDEPDDD